MFKFSVYLILLVSILSNPIFAQEHCGTVSPPPNQARNTLSDNIPIPRDQVVVIPVVVHVVYNTEAQNISDEQIQSQIDVLNEDFMRLNSDADDTWPQAASPNMKFSLAKFDPDGLPTNGITRTYTDSTEFVVQTSVKSDNTGGKDNWDAQSYLNMYICNIAGGILGYGTFPAADDRVDGIVIDYTVVGRGEQFSIRPNHNQGRVGTHEVGHWLRLTHIWGDGNCTFDDEIDDTPPADGPNYRCDDSDIILCPLNTFGAEMYQNYMDYTYDDCMNMFTEGQISLMRQNFYSRGSRVGILRSQALVPQDACVGSITVNLTINFDDFPEDTTWDIKNENGEIVASGGPYTGGSNIELGIPSEFANTEYTETLCFPDGCYNFTLYDSFGDGIDNSLSGLPPYTLQINDANSELITGNNFSSNEIQSQFCTACNESTPLTTITASSNTINSENTSTILTASGGTDGTNALIYWYDGPNATGNYLGSLQSIKVFPKTTTTYYARRVGSCNGSLEDVSITIFNSTDLSCNTSNAAASAYNDGWQTGDNDGSGFGAWALNLPVNASEGGAFIGGSDIGAQSWGLYANNSKLAEAIRPLSQNWGINDTFSIDLDNGNINAGGSVGFGLRNGSGEDLFEFVFRGGLPTYEIKNSNGSFTSTGIGFTNGGLNITITRKSLATVDVAITPIGGSTTVVNNVSLFTPAGGQNVAELRLFNFNAGGGSEFNAYFNNLEVCDEAFEIIPDVAELPTVAEQCEVISLSAPTANSGSIIATTETVFPLTTQGTVFIEWTYSDGLGTTFTQTQEVNINDTEVPVLSCEAITLYLDATGNATLGANAITDFSGTQGVGNWSYGKFPIADPTAFSELTNFTGFVWNNAGNNAILDFPQLDANGGHPQFEGLNAAVRRWTSNLDGTVYLSGDFFDRDTSCGDGANVRIYKNGVQIYEFLNITGNSTNYALTVSVQYGDTIDFAIDPKFDAACDDTHFTANIAVVSATDNCELDTINVSKTMFTCDDLGESSIFITATDVNNNQGSCSPVITVVDVTPPTMITNNLTINLINRTDYILTQDDIDALGANSFDSCSDISFSITEGQTSYNCSSIGQTFELELTGTDGSNNTASITVEVSITDTNSVCNNPPTASCQPLVLNTGDNCTATLLATDLDDISSDPDNDTLSFTITEIDGNPVNLTSTVLNVGVYTVTLTVSDGEFEDSCTAQVSVEDTTPPVALAQNVTIELDTNGMGSTTAQDVDNGSNDACGIQSLVLSKTDFDCNDVGENTVTLTVTDVNGNVATTTAIVTVEDNIPPVAIAQNVTVQLDDNGIGILTAAQVDNGSNDSCTNVTLSLDKTTFNCDDVSQSGFAASFTSGPDFINMGNSNTLKVSNALSIEAWIYPKGPGSSTIGGGIIVNKEGEYEIARFPDGTIRWAIANSSPGWFWTNTEVVAPLNQWTHVAFTYNGVIAKTFINGNLVHSINASGIINDAYTPDDNLRIGGRIPEQNQYFHGNIDEVRIWNSALTDSQINNQYNQQLVGDESGLIGYWSLDEGTGSTTIDKTSNGNNGTFNNQTFWTSPGALSGGNTVTLTVIDANGNSSTANATVTVEDNINPTITCPGDIIGIEATSAAGALVNYAAPEGTDNCSATTSLVAGLASGATFPIGDTTVTYEVTDASNNTAQCSFTVNVIGVAPVIVCPGTITVNNDAGNCSAIVNFDAKDATGIPASVITYSQDPNTSFPVGKTSVTATATNAVGSSICTFDVVVIDNEIPVITTNGNQTVNSDAGDCSAVVEVSASATDNCSVGQPEGTRADGLALNAAYPVGTTIITWNVQDVNGNPATEVTQTIIVEDKEAPVAICQDITVELNENGIATITAEDINNGSTDNCEIASISIDKDSFECEDLQGEAITKVVISQVYGGGGNSGATLTNDFIELFNSGNTPVDLNGWSVQYASSAGSSWAVTALTGTIQPGQYYLIQQAAGSGGTVALPTPDAVGTIAMAATNGKVLLANTTTAQSGTCPTGSQIIDFVGFGSANCSEGNAATPALNNTTAAIRNNSCTDTDNNSADFSTATPNPRNSATTPEPCFSSGGAVSVTLTVTDIHGNTSTCVANVTVIDNIAPVITTNGDQSVNSDAGECGALVEISATATDNCNVGDPIGVRSDELALSDPYPVGTTSITWNVQDVNGNAATTVTQTITVADNEAPAAICKDIVIELDENGVATITAEDIDNGSTDNCEIESIIASQTTFDCDDISTGDAPLSNDLFISEYIEGSGNNKAIEIYNGTGTPINLQAEGYNIKMFFNGSSSAGLTINLTGTIAEGDVFVLAQSSSSAAILAIADQTNGSGWYNGDDAVVLYKGNMPIDIIGQIGVDPGAAWTSGSISTADQTLVRNPNITDGNTDNAPGFPSLGTEWTSFPINTASNLGSHTVVGSGGGIPVTLTVTDIYGNSSNCVANVTVIDVIPPVLTAEADQDVNLDANCSITIPDLVDGSSATDNCSFSITQSPLAGTVVASSHNETVEVTVTATDDSGNTDVATVTLTAKDVIAPTIDCPADITINCEDPTSSATTGIATGSDNCLDVTITQSDVSTQVNDINDPGFYNYTITRTWRATDTAGNFTECEQIITVVDVTAPIVDCVNITVILDENGNASISEDDLDNGSVDDCSPVTLSINRTDFDCSAIGGDLDELIISEYVDGTGNNDWIEIYNGTGNEIVLAEVINGALVHNYSINIYKDGSTTPTSIGLLGTISDRGVYKFAHTDAPNASGVLSNFGSPAVVFDGNDAISLVNNITNSAVDIIGVIGENPGPNGWTSGGISTAGTTLVRKSNVQQGNISNFVASLPTEWIQFAQNDLSNLGSHDIQIINSANNVILTVTDVSGNVSECEANVFVVDNTPPVALCQDVTIQLDAFGNASVSPQAVDNGSNDACGIANLSLSQTAFSCDNVGANEVTLTVTDSNGNTATCTATVFVEDNVDPEVITKDITVQLDANGNASIQPSDINDGSNDACGIDTLSVFPNTFDCSNVGPNTVTLTVTDTNGNTAEADATVTVEDNVDPIAICKDITVQLDENGFSSIIGQDVDNGSSDACGIASYSVFPNEFGCDDIGENTVTLTVTDVNGNSSTCTSVVTVEGIIPEVTISSGELPEFCQGAVLVLTASTIQPDSQIRSFEWSGDGISGANDNSSVNVSGNGTYTVTVTSETNCVTTESFTVSGFDAGELISSYTILAFDDIFLHNSNLVETGAIGVTGTNGTVKLFQASTVVGFGQAANFNLNQGSSIGEQINQPANPTLPDFVSNTLSNNASPSVTIANGQSLTLNESVYNVVTVNQGATVTFNESNVYINELRTSDGANIEFAGCANVFINTKFRLAQNGVINSFGNNVVFFVNDDVQIEKGSDVRARIYSNGGEIFVKGANAKGNNAAEPTYMTGLFIANRVHGSINVIWNADDVCGPCEINTPSNRFPTASIPSNGSLLDFDVVAWPNPSNAIFNVRLKSIDMVNTAKIEVYDTSNKLVHSGTFRADEVYTFGDKLEGGVYIVQITQDKFSKTTRFVKY